MIPLNFIAEFKLGDIFCLKYSRDIIPIEVIGITYKTVLLEPEYTLKPIRFSDGEIIIGESALKELYYKIKIINR